MMYAYPFTLCHRGVVATFDLSAANLDLFENDHWLSNEKNCLVLWLTGPAFGPQEAPLHVAGAVPQDRAEMMRAWSVRELALFLTKADMEGPAQQLRAQGVAGEDFLHFTATDLKQDLRTTPFTAKKLLRIRDAYLAGP